MVLLHVHGFSNNSSACLHVQLSSLVHKKNTHLPSTTPDPLTNNQTLTPLDDQNGPRAEKLISPSSLRNWLKRIQVLFVCKLLHASVLFFSTFIYALYLI